MLPLRAAGTARTALFVLALCAIPLALAGCSAAGPSTSTSTHSTTGKSASSGSSSGGSSSSVERPLEICSLLTTSEATTALGTTISTTAQSNASSCDYNGDAADFRVDLDPLSSSPFADYVTALEKDDGATSLISGLGDEAAGNASAIIFRKGDVVMDIEVEGPDPLTEDQLVAVGKVVVSHLKK